MLSRELYFGLPGRDVSGSWHFQLVATRAPEDGRSTEAHRCSAPVSSLFYFLIRNIWVLPKTGGSLSTRLKFCATHISGNTPAWFCGSQLPGFGGLSRAAWHLTDCTMKPQQETAGGTSSDFKQSASELWLPFSPPKHTTPKVAEGVISEDRRTPSCEVISDPEVEEVVLNDTDRFLVMASDGVFEVGTGVRGSIGGHESK